MDIAYVNYSVEAHVALLILNLSNSGLYYFVQLSNAESKFDYFIHASSSTVMLLFLNLFLQYRYSIKESIRKIYSIHEKDHIKIDGGCGISNSHRPQ